MLMGMMKTNAQKSSINLMIMMTIQYARILNVHLVGGLIPNETSIVLQKSYPIICVQKENILPRLRLIYPFIWHGDATSIMIIHHLSM